MLQRALLPEAEVARFAVWRNQTTKNSVLKIVSAVTYRIISQISAPIPVFLLYSCANMTRAEVDIVQVARTGVFGVVCTAQWRGSGSALMSLGESVDIRRGGSSERGFAAMMDEKIREIVGKHVLLASPAASLAENADLQSAGMTSLASVSLMLALEDAFDVEFPDAMLKRNVFESIGSIRAALVELQAGRAAALVELQAGRAA